MKIIKKFAALVTAAVMCTALAFGVSAENADKVVDNGNLLSSSEEEKLETKLLDIIKKHNYKYDIVALTTNSTGSKSAEAYADDYYDYNDYGYDSEWSGLLMLVDMGDRMVHISTLGRGKKAFTDYGIAKINDTTAVYLADGDYYGAFNKFAELADDYITKYENSGVPYDTNSRVSGDTSGSGRMETEEAVMVSVVSGLIISLIVCLIMKAQLKTAVKQINARNYIKTGSRNISYSRDIYLYKNVTKHKIERSSSSGGGSSSHRSSSGRSHGGGGRHF